LSVEVTNTKKVAGVLEGLWEGDVRRCLLGLSPGEDAMLPDLGWAFGIVSVIEKRNWGLQEEDVVSLDEGEVRKTSFVVNSLFPLLLLQF